MVGYGYFLESPISEFQSVLFESYVENWMHKHINNESGYKVRVKGIYNICSVESANSDKVSLAKRQVDIDF